MSNSIFGNSVWIINTYLIRHRIIVHCGTDGQVLIFINSNLLTLQSILLLMILLTLICTLSAHVWAEVCGFVRALSLSRHCYWMVSCYNFFFPELFVGSNELFWVNFFSNFVWLAKNNIQFILCLCSHKVFNFIRS